MVEILTFYESFQELPILIRDKSKIKAYVQATGLLSIVNLIRSL